MRKTLLILALLVIFLLIPGVSAMATDTLDEIISEQIDSLGVDEISGLVSELTREISDYIPDMNLRELLTSMTRGQWKLNVSLFFNGILRFLFREVTANYILLGSLLILAIVCGIFKNFQSAFESNSIGKMAMGICHITLIGIAINSFHIAFRIGSEAISTMVTFMQAILPIMLTLMIAMGGIVSGGVFQPIILMTVSGVSTLIRDILLPMVFFSAILAVINNIAENIQVNKLAGLVRDVSVAVLGIFMSIFLGILVVQGATAAAVDGVSIRTAKFATKAFIPIVGGIFADTIDTVVGCSLLIKNALGAIGLIMVFIICLFPVLKILALIFIYRLVAALMEPIGEDRLIRCINSMGNSLVFLFVIVSSVGVMFFITLTTIIAVSNLTLMMR